MTLHTGEKKFLARTLLVSAAFLGLLAFPGAPRASAENYDSCQRRIAKADHKLHEAVEHHGWDSCWNQGRRWWDEDGHRWRSERDWDDHDHDRH